MIKVYKTILYSFLLILIGSRIYAQTSDLQFVVDQNDGTTYIVRIQIKGSSSFNLGTSNITFNYNSTDLGTPSLSTAYNFNTGSYVLDVSNPLSGVVSINIEYSGGTGNGSTVGTLFINVASVSFPINNPLGSSNLSFRESSPNKTGIFKDDNFTLVSKGTWSPENTQPLPVELTSFTAAVNINSVILNWQTATEVNNYGFDVERQVSSSQSSVGSRQLAVGSQWEKIGFVKGHGNSNSPKNYSFTDKNLTGGTVFKYRLKQIDLDGQFEYSDLVEVEVVPEQYSLSQNYPNPFNPITNIKFQLPQAAKVTLTIYNILGRQVANLVNENLEAGFHSIPFNAGSLASGTYIYRLQADPQSGSGKGFVQTKKMIVLK